MTYSDPVADFLNRVRNSLHAKHRYVDIPWSKMKESIAMILQEKGLVGRVLVNKDQSKPVIRILLRYTNERKPVIQGLKRYSRPGCRKYVKHDEIPAFFGGVGVPILSTSKGVMSGTQAKEQKAGGELLCFVW